MTIITDIDFFDTVYLKHDAEQLARMVTEINIKPAGGGHYQVIYNLSCAEINSANYREEFTRERELKISK